MDGDRQDADSLLVAQLQHTPEVTPRAMEAQGGMKPEVGVAATSPAIVPEQKPTIVYLE